MGGEKAKVRQSRRVNVRFLQHGLHHSMFKMAGGQITINDIKDKKTNSSNNLKKMWRNDITVGFILVTSFSREEREISSK